MIVEDGMLILISKLRLAIHQKSRTLLMTWWAWMSNYWSLLDASQVNFWCRRVTASALGENDPA
jgi:hypothetical protein